MKRKYWIFIIAILALIASLAWIAWGNSSARAQLTNLTQFLPIVSMERTPVAIGPDGGKIVALAIQHSNPDVMYAGAWESGIFKSLDGGATWRAINQGLTNLNIYSIAIDPMTPDTVYAGSYRNGVYKSIDGGQSWFWSGTGLNTEAIVYALVVHPTTPTTIYAGTRSPGSTPPWGGGVYKSVDGGATWQRKNNGLMEEWVYAMALDPNNPEQVYAATHEYGIHVSSDGGEQWRRINNGLEDTSTRSITVDYTNSATLYAGTWHEYYAFKTINGGQSWYPIHIGLSTKMYTIVMDPVTPSTLYGGAYYNGIVRTNDGGAKWDYGGLWGDFIYSIAIPPNAPLTVFAGSSENGLYKSLDGAAHWGYSQDGLQALQITSFAASVTPTLDLYAGVYGKGIYHSGDSGDSWDPRNTGITDLKVYVVAMDPSNSQVLYAGTETAGIFKTSDGGLNWIAINAGLPTGKAAPRPQPILPYPAGPEELFDAAFFFDSAPVGDAVVGEAIAAPIRAIRIDPSSPQTIYLGTGGRGVYKSTDGGGTWVLIGWDGYTINGISLNPFDPNIVYLAEGFGQYGNFIKSLNAGAEWITGTSGLPAQAFYDITVDPGNPQVLFLATGSGLYKSTDGGTVWALAGLDGLTVRAIGIDPLQPSRFFAATHDGLYRSRDAGDSWQRVPAALASDVIQALWIAPAGERLVIFGTKTGGSYLLQP